MQIQYFSPGLDTIIHPKVQRMGLLSEKFEMKFLLHCKNNYLAEFSVFLEQS